MDELLLDLAEAAGIAPSWKDVFGEKHTVAIPTLQAVLAALDFPAASEAQIKDSRARATAARMACPPLVTAQQGLPVVVPVGPARYHLALEDGRSFDGFAEPHADGAVMPPILEPGYHELVLGESRTVVAVAPSSGFAVTDAFRRRKGWGIALQLYGLRRAGDGGIGDFEGLAQLAPHAAALGAQAIAISPVHAQFSADPGRFAPYAPSSRAALNVLHAAMDAQEQDLETAPLIDWPNAARAKLDRLRQAFPARMARDKQGEAFAEFCRSEGPRLWGHVVFEALHGHMLRKDSGLWHWRHWPQDYQEPDSQAVRRFAEEHAEEVKFHAWLQFLAHQGLAKAQISCRDSGMAIGLISDLAVGTESGGSQCWSRQSETLLGLTVGAPPDLLQRRGQNWGLTAFSPLGLVESGFATYRDMLHTALVHAGGVRIDHAMGLNRLWVIPEGASGADGAYLNFPERDLLALIKLESFRHRAVVIAEDLGTVPEGFHERLSESGISGMRVLWFERDDEGNFTPPSCWSEHAAGLTSTHDLPTLAGWWMGRDLDWQERLGLVSDPEKARLTRAGERAKIWVALQRSGAGEGSAPAEDEAGRFVTAACRHVGSSTCDLAIVPVEDALGLAEQPNLPGTVDEHPNWRRRLPAASPAQLFDPQAKERLRALNAARGR